MSRGLLAGALLGCVCLNSGCSQSAATKLQPGDIVQPELSFAPEAPWATGSTVAIGMLVRVERAATPARYLNDEEVPAEQATMHLQVLFLAEDERPLGEPTLIPLVRDC
jgi:hypothetical protein